MSSKGSGQPFRRLLAEARPFSGLLAVLFALELLSIGGLLLMPLPVKIAVDHVIGDQPLPRYPTAVTPAALAASKERLLLTAAGLVLGVALLRHAVQEGIAVLNVYVGEHLVLGFRNRLFGHLQRLSLAFHDSTRSADSLYRVQYDATAVKSVVISGFLPLAVAGLKLAVLLVVAARLDGRLLLVVLAAAPCLFALLRIYRRPLRRLWRETKEIQSSVLAVAEEALSTQRMVKAFGGEAHEGSRFARHAARGVRAAVRATVTQSVFSFVLGVALAVLVAVVLYLGTRHVLDGRLSLGDLMMALFYLGALLMPLAAIGSTIARLQDSLASAERALSVLDSAPDVAERLDARPLETARGAFVFEAVEFAYGDDPPVLRLSLEVAAGARVGIAGETGAGKTTLVSLLPRFYDPTAGRILLDGVDLRDVRLADLRRQFAIVLQDTTLFSTSVAENIAYGRPGASREEIVEAARKANAHDFVSRLGEGYDTLVGDRGARLSGGQRQLIALARAFLRDAPILILDEPTSAVDAETEKAALEGLERLMAGRTTFLISHRLHALDGCDPRLVLRDGRLIDEPEYFAGRPEAGGEPPPARRRAR